MFQKKERVVFMLLMSLVVLCLIGCGGGAGGGGGFTPVFQSQNPALIATLASSQSAVVPGGVATKFATLTLDATGSPEDVELSSLPLTLITSGGGTPSNLTSLKLVDGTTSVNTGSNVGNPFTESADIIFDAPLRVLKGTVKTLTLQANVSAGAPIGASYAFTLGTIVVSGSTSRTIVVAMSGTSMSSSFRVLNSALMASADVSSPSASIAVGGTTGKTVLVVRFRPTGEAMNLERVYLSILQGKASDLVRCTLWQGNVQIGSTVFTGSSTQATAVLAERVNLPKDQDTLITVKADIADIGVNQPGTPGGLIWIGVPSADAIGLESGTLTDISNSGQFGIFGAAFRIFKSIPSVALDTMSAQGASDGKLMRFKISASPQGDVSIAKLTCMTRQDGCILSGVNLFAFVDAAYSTPIAGVTQNGQVAAVNPLVSPQTFGDVYTITPTDANGARTIITIPAGVTRYFELRALVVPLNTNFSTTGVLFGDYQDLPPLPLQVIDQISFNTSFIWSGNNLGPATLSSEDYVNGFVVPGLSPNGIYQTRSN